MLSMKIFFQILFVWQEIDLGFSSDFEKKILQKKHQNRQHQYKIRHDKGSTSGPGERVQRSFMKQ